MNDEVACYLKERAEVARSDKQNTTAMDLDKVYSTTLNAFNKENISFSKTGRQFELVEFFKSRPVLIFSYKAQFRSRVSAVPN